MKPINKEISTSVKEEVANSIDSHCELLEWINCIDIGIVIIMAFLMTTTYVRDGTIGPIDISLGFLHFFQFSIMMIIMCEINSTNCKILDNFECILESRNKVNRLTYYEINLIIGMLASVAAAVSRY